MCIIIYVCLCVWVCVLLAESCESSRRVDVAVASEDGITPLHDAVAKHQVDVATILLRHGGMCQPCVLVIHVSMICIYIESYGG